MKPEGKGLFPEFSEVRVGTATEESNYREINLEFLAKGGDEGFDIFYKTDSYGTVKFLAIFYAKVMFSGKWPKNSIEPFILYYRLKRYGN